MVSDANLCRDDSTIVITDPSPLAITRDIKKPDCHGGSNGEISMSSSGGTPPYFFRWENGQFTRTATSLSKGYHQVSVFDANSCKLDTLLYMDEPGPIEVRHVNQPPLCPEIGDGAIYVSASGGNSPYYYSWSDYNTGPEIYNMKEGLYTVTVTDNKNCQVIDTIILDAQREHCLTIPNVFTPNGDGSNDTWEIDNIYLYPGVTIEVYDRWGEIVHKSTNGYTRKWDGKKSGKKVPVDTYHYIIDLKDIINPIQGNVTILYDR